MAGVKPGSVVYIAGAGPVGLACASSCQLLGAAIVIVGDLMKNVLLTPEVLVVKLLI
jgi:glutathione-independent formaldehyde dehydrogenase